jgi:hypothetical protein
MVWTSIQGCGPRFRDMPLAQLARTTGGSPVVQLAPTACGTARYMDSMSNEAACLNSIYREH